jgi:thiamine kinase-like enzyme
MKLSLSGLAKIHAASLVLFENDKNAFSGFEIGFYNRKTRAFDVMYTSNLEVFAEEVSGWTDWDQSTYFAEKLRAFKKTVIENGCKAFDYNENDLNVFNHGDLWTNNILFNYNGDNPSEAIILDFQYSFYGSASLDLLYFLFTSLADHLRIERMEELIQFYYYELKDLLQRLNYNMNKLPSLQNFHIEVLRKYFYGKLLAKKV